MIEPPRLIRRDAQVLSSQLGLELGIAVAAFVGALALARVLLLVVGIGERVWAGATIYGLTEPLVWLLTLLPGADRTLLGRASLADVTAAAVSVLAPLVLVARRAPR